MGMVLFRDLVPDVSQQKGSITSVYEARAIVLVSLSPIVPGGH